MYFLRCLRSTFKARTVMSRHCRADKCEFYTPHWCLTRLDTFSATLAGFANYYVHISSLRYRLYILTSTLTNNLTPTPCNFFLNTPIFLLQVEVPTLLWKKVDSGTLRVYYYYFNQKINNFPCNYIAHERIRNQFRVFYNFALVLPKLWFERFQLLYKLRQKKYSNGVNTLENLIFSLSTS